jgi:hypothetical protein
MYEYEPTESERQEEMEELFQQRKQLREHTQFVLSHLQINEFRYLTTKYYIRFWKRKERISNLVRIGKTIKNLIEDYEYKDRKICEKISEFQVKIDFSPMFNITQRNKILNEDLMLKTI